MTERQYKGLERAMMVTTYIFLGALVTSLLLGVYALADLVF